MLTLIELPFDYSFLIVSSQFIVVFTFSTADNCFGLLVLISTVRSTKNSLKKKKKKKKIFEIYNYMNRIGKKFLETHTL